MWHLITIITAVLQATSAADYPLAQCFSGDAPGMPKDHFYNKKKCRPLIIGHRGDPMFYQENTLDGFKSTLIKGGDGFELDVYLTADNKLVVFHDEDTKRLTGVAGKIQKMTSAQIKKLRYKRSIKYGPNTYHYDRRRKLAFLDDLLKWAENRNALVYIELKPTSVISKSAAEIRKSRMAAKMAANLVKKYRMEKKVVFSSFDTVKVAAVKEVDSRLVVGFAWAAAYWQQKPVLYKLLKNQLKSTLPGLSTCLNPISSSSSSFIDFLFKSGTIAKSLKAGFSTLQLEMFNNPAYGSTAETIKMVKRNYGKKFAVVAYTFYNMELTASQLRQQVFNYEKLISQGIDMIITDDVECLQCLASKTSKKYYRCKRQQCMKKNSHGYPFTYKRDASPLYPVPTLF